MKIRNGFVSNSSSSSFVVVGMECKLSEELKEEIAEDNQEYQLLEWYTDNKKEGICKQLANLDDDNYEIKEFSTRKIDEIETEIQEKFNIKNKAMLYIGRQYN